MRAIQLTEFGGPEVLKVVEMDVPKPNGHDVLIEIKAIGVNYADTARREGQYVVDTPLPYVPGSEVAGVVKAVGDKVTSVKPGSSVVTLLGTKNATGYAEYTLADERGLIPIPDGMDLHHAVALPLQGLSAYHTLKTMGRFENGETVLIHAAAGGLGTIAVQLARLWGAKTIIGTASTEEKRQLASDMGVDVTVDYTKDGWEQEVLAATDGNGVDVILEMAGGDVFRKSLKCLAPFGRLVIYGVASGEQSRFYPSSLMEKNQSVVGFFLPQIMRKPSLYQKSLEELLNYMKNGELQLTIGGVFDLEKAAEVHTLLQGRKTKGKLILTP
ncbi:NADPH:quinone oxidoreductase family protein [Alkalihalobacillus macyae]|uniref:quinone oxidoreductase family protein n=1 Tax=Guptibacillus hwajinpoensis TaxID=208199 RepID=UPI00273C3985|nr:NADPH:quinone oxidoreductase family protein [Alkalihalobacillus macyae]MDP4550013.1 NADPH:quinone oxidoreductase family protein [Alkalihalobacillus macyae]